MSWYAALAVRFCFCLFHGATMVKGAGIIEEYLPEALPDRRYMQMAESRGIGRSDELEL